jgi:hypothetical protein
MDVTAEREDGGIESGANFQSQQKAWFALLVE